ncbi:CAP domain-containing protein [Erythrobacter sp. EC-HK427]|uniref:CAP domain-containing protein n=1 Tax=Erythrobacter sp. EC-HK427 TaxID=2038396 RepID=UPI00125A249A|nr:CAP domain-containing protein [Erythrobacter sp. EC-HK427]VVT12628.1 conserved hypothetical protein [Erythrobacter sp. EC-HK427]
MNPTPQEQLFLELINRLRMDPHGEYARLTTAEVLAEIQGALNFFGVELSSFQAAMLAFAPVNPLAWNSALALAAQRHNDEMIAADTQSHQLPGELGLGARITDAGYTNWSRLGENIYAYSDSVVYGHAGFVVDWGFDDEDFDGNNVRYNDWQTRGDGIQDPAGHLLSLMNANFTEIGIAVTAETNSATSVGPLVVTQDLGTRFGYQAQFVGVVINDTDNDDFYDIGEGMGGVTVTLTGTSGTFSTMTWDAGGWQIAVPAGTYDIVFSGGGLVGTITASATLGTANVKLDVEAADAVDTSNVQNGTPGVDTLNGGAGVDVLNGLAGDDVLFGFGGNDTLDGGLGIDDMTGGAGDDSFYIDSVFDVVRELAGDGTDRIYTSINLNPFGNRYAHVESFALIGSATALHGTNNGEEILANPTLGSRLFGYGGADTLVGSIGADRLYGGLGNDTLLGGAGRDLIDGQAGADDMRGGADNDNYIVDNLGDTVTENAGEGTDTVRAFVNFTLGDNIENLILVGGATQGDGNGLANAIYAKSPGAVLRGFGGNDFLRGSQGDDTLDGGANNDTINGLGGNDQIFGGSGNDELNGSHGNDTIDGGSGDDTIFGGRDNDTIIGGIGKDTMRGDIGADVFAFDDGHFAGLTTTTADRITDFDQLEGDRIDLSLVDAITGGGDNAFTFIGAAEFTGVAGQLRFEQSGGVTMVYMDTNGDMTADYAIALTGLITLTEADFVL